MQFKELQEKLGTQHTFTLQDVENAFGKADRAQMSRWENKGWLQRLTEGIYTFPKTDIDIHLLSNEIRPSYISLEYALSYYGIIPDIAQTVTCVSTMTSTTIETPVGTFIYKKIKPELFRGYVLKPSTYTADKVKSIAAPNTTAEFKIATPEKALFDLVYLRKDLSTPLDFESMRFTLPENFDPELLAGFFNFVDSEIRKNRMYKFFTQLFKEAGK
ncbi:hypothetical protein GF360_04005 [candidate division WWE3 bacterium]|nr:hypothetical protein [candidate division WWE3 bacterium]